MVTSRFSALAPNACLFFPLTGKGHQGPVSLLEAALQPENPRFVDRYTSNGRLAANSGRRLSLIHIFAFGHGFLTAQPEDWESDLSQGPSAVILWAFREYR